MSPDRVSVMCNRAVTSSNRAVRPLAVLLAVFCCLSAVSAQWLETTSRPVAASRPGFDPEDVVRQVRPARPEPSAVSRELSALDDGEFLIDTSITLFPALSSPEYPAVAFDGENFLVVWYAKNPDDLWCDIYGARVTPGGTVLDPAGIIVCATAASKEYPAVAFDGANFLVVWHQTDFWWATDVYGARVTPAGAVLDSTGIAISTAADIYSGFPAIGFDGENYLVVWGYRDLYGARVSRAGVVLDSAGIAISTEYSSNPAVSSDGENFLVVWEKYSPPSSNPHHIYGARVTPAGVVLDPNGIQIAAWQYDQVAPAVSFDGTNYFVVWTYHNGYGATFIDGVRVSQDGTVLGQIDITRQGAGESSVSFDGTNYLVVWGYRDLYGARVSQAGVVLDSAGIAISTAPTLQLSPAVCFDGTNCLVVWEDGPDMTYQRDIYGARVTPAGVVFDEGPVAVQNGLQRYPELARGTGSQVFLVYQGWAGTVGGKTYNTYRTWGKLDLARLTGIADSMSAEVRTLKYKATVVRRVLYLERRPSSSPSTSYLLDISGRKVMELQPGANDVRPLSPGVYFVREAQVQTQAQPHAVRKVILAR